MQCIWGIVILDMTGWWSRVHIRVVSVLVPRAWINHSTAITSTPSGIAEPVGQSKRDVNGPVDYVEKRCQ